ncbi:hypothetical protein AVEN_221360-1 [Araneus ventricosus]|uniref:Uncharacterized protein n=1 Tax=Araneus ventricosus TaxID=182803 RepID=A0A4Y2AYI1_ARAVE|nr:hypothetical protein AVEN_221360-1 [Araneus ventricosus]
MDSFKEAVPKASSTLRSDVVTQHGEPLAIPNVSYVNEFVKESDTLEDELQLKSISSEQSMQLPVIPDDVNNESREQREDEDLQLKSISSEKSIQLPDIPEDISNVSQEQREGSIVSNEREDQTLSPFKKHDYAARRDSFACSEVPSSDGFKISEDSDEYTKKNFDEKDDEYIKNNPFSATVINKSTNSNFRERKQEDKVENSSENMDDYSNGQDFGEAQNMQIDSSKKNGKGYRVYNGINESIIRWKQKNERVNLLEYKSDSEDNFENVQKIQNKDLQDDELDNNQPQTAALQIKRKVKICVGVDNKRQQEASILNRSQSSTSLRRKHINEGGNSSEDVDKSDSDDSFEIVQNIQNEELQDYESDNNQQETATHQRKTNNRVKFASILSRSTNSSQKKKHRNKIKNSFEDLDNYNRANNFEEAETPKRMGTLCRGIKLKFSNRIKTPLRRKYTNEGGHLFEDMDKNDSEDSFENVKNIQNELQDAELDNNQPETATHQINRKINKHIGADNITQQDANITNRSQSSTSLRREHKKERENSFEDMDKSDNENFENVRKNQNDRDKVGNSSEDNYDRGGNFEGARNMEINTSKKKRKPYGGVGIKRNRRVNRSRKVVNSLSRSKNSTGREVSEGVQNNQNEAAKINWPRCCLEESETLHFGQTFRILQPVFRDDIPIDSITLVNLGFESKMKCKH